MSVIIASSLSCSLGRVQHFSTGYFAKCSAGEWHWGRVNRAANTPGTRVEQGFPLARFLHRFLAQFHRIYSLLNTLNTVNTGTNTLEKERKRGDFGRNTVLTAPNTHARARTRTHEGARSNTITGITEDSFNAHKT